MGREYRVGPTVILVLVVLPLLFPTGRPPGPHWGNVGWAALVGGVLKPPLSAPPSGGETAR